MIDSAVKFDWFGYYVNYDNESIDNYETFNLQIDKSTILIVIA